MWMCSAVRRPTASSSTRTITFLNRARASTYARLSRAAMDGALDPRYKWVEVWAHIYLGKIYDVAGERTRAVNEFSKAQQTNDDTGGAQAEAKKYLNKPFTEGSSKS